MTRPQQLRLERAQQMVDEVAVRILASPGDRAALRRALRRTPESIHARGAHRIVARYVGADADAATERACYAVASMIAAQPRQARAGGGQTRSGDHETEESGEPENTDPAADRATITESLGATLGRAAARGTLKADTTEARLHLLCRQQLTGVHRHLPRLILQLRAEKVPVSWARLVVDLASWETRRDQVTKRWLQDYYRTFNKASAAEEKKPIDTDSESENL